MKSKQIRSQELSRPTTRDLAQTRHSSTQTVVYWAKILETLYNRQFVAESTKPDITVSAWRILAWLAEFEPLTVGEIVAHTHIERTVLSRLLDRMAEKGLVSRKRRQSDRRVIDVCVTARGRVAVAQLKPIRRNVYARAVEGIDPRHLDFVCEIIIRMINNLGGRESLFPSLGSETSD